MKKVILFLFAVYCSICLATYAQTKCKYREVNKYDFSYKLASGCNIKIDTIVKDMYMVILFDHANANSRIELVKGQGKYYLSFYYDFPGNGDCSFLINNSLDFHCTNGETLQLYPLTNFHSSNSKSTVYYRGENTINSLNDGILKTDYISVSAHSCQGLYPISKEQLKLLSVNEVDKVTIHYTTSKQINGSYTDKDGKNAIDYEIKEKRREHIKTSAFCMSSL
jgi:hypothetical protein